MLCKVNCACCNGLEVIGVTIEVAVSEGIQFYLVGLPDNAVKESQQRISSALESYGYRIPGRKIIINLAPANVRKAGSSFDVGIAIGILFASGQIGHKGKHKDKTDEFAQNLADFYILGELALDGSLRPIPGALPIIIHAREQGFKGCILPYDSALEGAETEGITVFGAKTLEDVISILLSPQGNKDKMIGIKNIPQPAPPEEEYDYDFANVCGQLQAKRGLEIAAAGGHNVIMIGSPGSGKTFMAKCLPGILPPMTKEEAIETSKVYSVAGLLGGRGLLKTRPFRAPHHTITVPALVGGGNKGMPGEISLAHNGVLFADELAEFERKAIDVFRQPLENGVIEISRVSGKYCYPARFMFVGATNPCPCGYLLDEPGKCKCSSQRIMRYSNKISGPIYDRIDIQLLIRSVPTKYLIHKAKGESSAEIAKRVRSARQIQKARFEGSGIFTNSQMTSRLIEKYCPLSLDCNMLMEKLISKMGVSARGYTRIIKIARTIADLAATPDIRPAHISEAAAFHFLERSNIMNFY